ncbi:MAG: LytTR family transcriptional regulator DNA-binding domain-containing protein [Christensenellaceae bacterium]|nr:LytTR family transcriptional regulator DNA-binding domain-containing protein [Christensenellaceae bacterium]
MKIAICDADELRMEASAVQLKQLARRHGVDIQLKYYKNADALIFRVEDARMWPDLLLLSLCTPETEGVRAAKWLRDQGCPCEIILMAPSLKYVLFGYDIDALYYFISGNVRKEKFEAVFLKALQRHNTRAPKAVTFVHNGENRVIHIQDILYFKVENRLVTLHSSDGEEPFQFYATLDHVKNMLHTDTFLRIHRSYLVATSVIKQLCDRSVTLHDGTVLPVGRTYYAGLLDFLRNN